MRDSKKVKSANRAIVVVDATLRPLEMLQLVEQLNGSAGSNRAPFESCQLRALTDVDALKAWIEEYKDTPRTQSNYRREVERLLLWSTLQMRKPLSSLTHEDLRAYIDFLADPQPASLWVIPKQKDGRPGKKVSRRDPNWRPFAGPLSQTSIALAKTTLNSMFCWLVEAGYLKGNPLALVRSRSVHPAPRVMRLLDDALWNEVKATISQLPEYSARAREHAVRARWLFSLLFLGGLRISEVCNNTMGQFSRSKSRDGVERWWLDVVGKGDKERLIPATRELIDELARYRAALGLKAVLPIPKEPTPLLVRIGGAFTPMKRAAVHNIVKDIFAKTAERLRHGDVAQQHQADLVERASAHWLRHTAASRMANNEVPLTNVRDNFGHASIQTTSAYLHSEDNARHDETEKKHKIGW